MLVAQAVMFFIVFNMVKEEDSKDTAALSIECTDGVCDTTWHYTVYEDGMEHDYFITRVDGKLDTTHFYVLSNL